MKKKIIILGVLMLIVLQSSVFAEENISVHVAGREKNYYTNDVIMKNDRIFVPIGVLASMTGEEFLWNEYRNNVYIKEAVDYTVPLAEWKNGSYMKLVEDAFADINIPIEEVEFSGLRGIFETEKPYAGVEFRTTGYCMADKLIPRMDLCDYKEMNEQGIEDIFWYYDIKTGEYGKLGEGKNIEYYYSIGDYTKLFPFYNTKGQIVLTDMETMERHILSEGFICAIIDNTIYYTKYDGKMYVNKLNGEPEKVYDMPVDLDEWVVVCTDGKSIFFLTDWENDTVIEYNVETGETKELKIWDSWFAEEGYLSVGKRNPLDFSTIGRPNIYINGILLENAVEIKQENGYYYTYVPLRVIAEALNYKVEWIDGENRVNVTKLRHEKPRYGFDYKKDNILVYQ